MKKLAAFLCAAVAVVAGVAYTPAFSASAADVTLTPEQTRALFSDRLTCQYYDGYAYQECYFDYFTTAVVTGEAVAWSGSWQPAGYSINNQKVLVYRCSANDFGVIASNPNNQITALLSPIFDISGVNTFKLTCGFSTGRSTQSDTYGWFEPNSYMLNQWNIFSNYRNYDDSSLSRQSYYVQYSDQNVKWTSLKITDPDNDSSFLYGAFNTFQLNLVDTYQTFTIKSTTEKASTGLYLSSIQTTMVGKLASAGSGRYDDYYFFVSCPYLSDSYVAVDPPNWESSGGGSESSGGGYDGPDYSEQLALILAKLDLIINNDFNFDVDLSADVSGLESRLDGVNSRLDVNNSRLDGANSRLDGTNSRLDGANSRLDGVNSRLDNISAELHDINSAPNESLPDTGGENSEFEHQADMYMQDFRNEYEDSENQVFEVIDKGTGFLGFVRDMLITSHLAQILPLLALLFIAHYVIFERGG